MADTVPETTHDPSGRSNAAEFSVSELASAIKRMLEDGFGYVRLRGEISGFRGPHSSGHCYFGLKDERAKIDAVIWRGVYGKLKIKPEEGMEVIARGRITTYPNSSKYQIVIEALEPAGVGALMALLEERKKTLAAEGLFDDDRKRPLPFLPRVVGIVTSPTGAVIRDMLHGFHERFPAHVVIWPVRVQGEDSAAEIATAIRGFNALTPGGRFARPDVLIVARGGGSLEDLWSFNEERVVRAAADSEIPLISAVGHETDWTLLDLVADARAPTPTKAAEWAVPKFGELMGQAEELGQRLKTGARRCLESARAHLRAAARGLPRLGDLVALPRQRFDAVERRLAQGLLGNTRAHGLALSRVASRLRPGLLSAKCAMTRAQIDLLHRRNADSFAQSTNRHRARLLATGGRLRLDLINNRCALARARQTTIAADFGRAFRQRLGDWRTHLDGTAKLLSTLGYHSVLARGFAVVRDRSGQMVRTRAEISPGMALEIELRDGTIDVQARGSGADAGDGDGGGDKRRPQARPKPGTVRATVKIGDKSGSGQGSLF